MNVKLENVFCKNANKTFRVVKFSFTIEEDKSLVDSFIKAGKELTGKLNPVLARDSSRERKYTTLQSNAIAGIIAEYVWRYWLSQYAEKNNIELSVNETQFTDVRNQIDIEVAYQDGLKKQVEVRSSFPYTGITNGVCKVFDILGWYTNNVKIEEIKKDYYVRSLFPYKVQDFYKLLFKGFDVYLTGGATKHFLNVSPNARNKQLMPYDDFVDTNNELAEYRVIEPIVNAMDTKDISDQIINGLQ